jgi:clathrin heavy chain
VFWKWVSDTTISLVSETAVYHWSISDQTSPPQKVFDRHATLARAQIINYHVTPDEKWLVLVGISGNTTNPSSAFRIKRSMQLYSRERGVSQPIEGHAASFGEMKQDGHQAVTKLFTFAVRTATGAKVRYSTRSLCTSHRFPFQLHIIEIDHQATPLLQKRMLTYTFHPRPPTTFLWPCRCPRSTVSSVTKYGFIHLYDLEPGACVYMNRIYLSRQNTKRPTA